MSKSSRLPTQWLSWIKALVARSGRDDPILFDNGPQSWYIAITRKLDPSFVRIGNDYNLKAREKEKHMVKGTKRGELASYVVYTRDTVAPFSNKK